MPGALLPAPLRRRGIGTVIPRLTTERHPVREAGGPVSCRPHHCRHPPVDPGMQTRPAGGKDEASNARVCAYRWSKCAKKSSDHLEFDP